MGTCKKTTIFTAREGGYFNYRIPGIITTPRGVILATCEARRNDGGDHDVIDILMRRSLDGGITWEEPTVTVDHSTYPETTMNNFVCIPDAAAGTVHALFCNRYLTAYHMTSHDDGATWSAPVEITSAFEGFRSEYDFKILAIGPGHGIQHSSGRLITPVWLSTAEKIHQPNRAGALYSDDHGRTWQAGGVLPDMGENTNEACVAELSNGRVMFNVRIHSNAYRRLISISNDGRGGWSTPEPDEALIDPICHAGLLQAEGSTLLFSNPNATSRELKGCWEPVADRKNLTVRLSEDDGVTWPKSKVIEAGPSGYSDLSKTRNGEILCIYEDGMINAMADTARITVARFSLEWVRQ